jgi:hypothetical protein
LGSQPFHLNISGPPSKTLAILVFPPPVVLSPQMYVTTQVFVPKRCFFSLADLPNPRTINQRREFCIIGVGGDWRQYAAIPPLKAAFKKLAKPAGYRTLWECLDTVCDVWKDPIEVSVQMRTGLTSEPRIPVEKCVIPHVQGRNAADGKPITVVRLRKVRTFRKETKVEPAKSSCSHLETDITGPMSIQQSDNSALTVPSSPLGPNAEVTITDLNPLADYSKDENSLFPGPPNVTNSEDPDISAINDLDLMLTPKVTPTLQPHEPEPARSNPKLSSSTLLAPSPDSSKPSWAHCILSVSRIPPQIKSRIPQPAIATSNVSGSPPAVTVSKNLKRTIVEPLQASKRRKLASPAPVSRRLSTHRRRSNFNRLRTKWRSKLPVPVVSAQHFVQVDPVKQTKIIPTPTAVFSNTLASAPVQLGAASVPDPLIATNDRDSQSQAAPAQMNGPTPEPSWIPSAILVQQLPQVSISPLVDEVVAPILNELPVRNNIDAAPAPVIQHAEIGFPYAVPRSPRGHPTIRHLTLISLVLRLLLARQRGRVILWNFLWTVEYIGTLPEMDGAYIYHVMYDGQLLAGVRLIELDLSEEKAGSKKMCVYGCKRGIHQWLSNVVYGTSGRRPPDLRQQRHHQAPSIRLLPQCRKFPACLNFQTRTAFLTEERDFSGLDIYCKYLPLKQELTCRRTAERGGHLTGLYMLGRTLLNFAWEKVHIEEVREWYEFENGITRGALAAQAEE